MPLASAMSQMMPSNSRIAALLDQAIAAHQAAQSAFSASAAEARTQRDSLELDLQRVQQKLAEESDLRARCQKTSSDGQMHILELESASQSLQKQVRA